MLLLLLRQLLQGFRWQTSDDAFKNIKSLNVIFYNLPVNE
jgi:hypothetical protein